MAKVCLSDIMITMSDFKEKIKHDEKYQILLKTVHKKSDVERACGSCRLCLDNAPSQTPPLIPSSVPQYPFQYAVADLFHKDGKEYIAYADRLTGWIELAFFPVTTKSCDVIDAIRNIFQRFGVPEEISLGGPNLLSKEFSCFLDKWGTSAGKTVTRWYTTTYLII